MVKNNLELWIVPFGWESIYHQDFSVTGTFTFPVVLHILKNQEDFGK